VPKGSNHRITNLGGTTATGMSSETLLFDAEWDIEAGHIYEQLVARVAPDPGDVPVFPSYDLPGQFKTIELVAELSDVPVPAPWWCETEPDTIGAAYFVMGRIDGVVPPDVMPYTFGDNWLFDAATVDQALLQEETISVLARLHAIPNPTVNFAHVTGKFPGATALRRHFAKSRHLYEWAAADSGRSALLERGYAWLEDHWPAHESPTVFSWGDSRIGNILYRAFKPVAVLDWEMATLGPAELDIAWLVYLHRMFQDLGLQMGLPGMPAFLQPDDVASTYEKMSGQTPRDLDWYITYSCVQMATIFLRTGQRAVHFGEREAPADADELLMNAPTLLELIARP
jgi:aminoglycoside phosphotransferase (APT) family kinase protein